jgi:hypothetical protein
MTSEVEPAYYYYAQSLRSIGEMTKQIKLWKNLIKCQETTAEGTFAKNETMDAIKANSGRYKVEDAGINSPIQIMGLLCIQIKIVFASADTGSLGHRRHTWTGQPFTKLYVSDVGEEMSRKSRKI